METCKLTMKTDKFKTNSFAKKYKEELSKADCGVCGELGCKYCTAFGEENRWELDNEYARGYNQALENAEQVKSWKRGPISETVNLTYIFLAFIIGFSVCAVVMTPLVINSI